MNSSGHILVIDVGSSSVRCSLYDETGEPVEGTEASRKHRFTSTPDGGATLDADRLCELILEIVDEMHTHAEARDVIGVAMSTFWHSLLGLDRRGRPTTPIY